jgi:tetratricopeptide (TPR) repeat protein
MFDDTAFSGLFSPPPTGQNQQPGDLALAEAAYFRILRAEPDRVEALHGLGGLAYRQGKYRKAIRWLRKAVALRPDNPLLHSNLAAAYQAAGRLPEAEDCCRQALRLRPDLAEAYNNLASVLQARGNPEEAAARYRQAVLAAAQQAPAHANLGLLLHELGKPLEAADHLRAAVRLQPDLAEAHYGLGLLRLEQNEPAEAEAHFQEAARHKPHLADAHFQLGQALRRQGRAVEALPHLFRALQLGMAWAARKPDATKPAKECGSDKAAEAIRNSAPLGPTPSWLRKPDEAVAHCREVLRLDPDHPEAHYVLGRALATQGKLAEAVKAFHHALRVRPEHAEACVGLGAALREQGHLEQAVGYLREALRLRPALAEAHCQLGLALTDQSRLEEAAEAYRQALRLKPNSAAVLAHLGVLLEELSQADEGQRLLTRAVALDPDDPQVHVHAGMSLVNQGRPHEAKEHFQKAIALRLECGAAYFFLARDSDHHFSAAEIDRLHQLAEQELLRIPDRINCHFALARVYDRAGAFSEAFHHCDRGNALKREYLRWQGNGFDAAAHARFCDRLLAAFDEAYFRGVQGFGSDSELPVFIVGMPRSGTTLVEQVLASHPAVFGAGEIRNLRRFLADLPAELCSAADFPECMAGLDLATSRRLAESYLVGLRRLGGDRLRVTDKVPMNFHRLGLIATFFPQARIIHCRRDPPDVCWSCYFQNFRELHFACDLRALGAYHRQYERLMDHWREVLPLPVFEVRYEEMVTDWERVARELIAFCRLPWDDACLRFYEIRRLVRTSSNLQVRRPVYQKAVGYWKNYAAHLGPLLEALQQT